MFDKTDPVNLELLAIAEDLEIFDVIPLEEKLLLLGNGNLYQYKYVTDELELISVYSLD